MHQVKRLFFVPVGLPGMGKSTLAKHIKNATEKHLSAEGLASTKADPSRLQALLSPDMDAASLLGSLPSVEFNKISYDRILSDFTAAYIEKHPEVAFHEGIDIIRADAD